jgi:hypothetical protein
MSRKHDKQLVKFSKLSEMAFSFISDLHKTGRDFPKK